MANITPEIIKDIIIFFLGIIFTIISFFIKRIFFSKAPKTSFSPSIQISPVIQNSNRYAEIYNIGNDPIENLEIEISWIQEEKIQHRKISNFFNRDQDPITYSSHYCKFLNSGEKKIMANLPKYSDNGKITFNVKGKGINSKNYIDEKFTIDNEKT